MKTYLITVLLFLSVPIIAQETTTKKISIGVTYSPNYSYRSISSTPEFLKSIRDDDKAVLGQSLNLLFRYRLNDCLGIESGISFQNRGYKMQMDTYLYFDEYDPAIPERSEYTDRFQYLGIPVKLTLKKEFNHIALVSSIGFMGNFLLKSEQVTTNYFDDHKEKITNNTTSEFKTFVLTATIGAGIEYRFNTHYKIILMPAFQRDITPISDGDMKHYLWDMGLNVGLLYEF